MTDHQRPGYWTARYSHRDLWTLPPRNGHRASADPDPDAIVELPSEEWQDWADRIIGDDLSQPERAARARKRLSERQQQRGLRRQ